MEAIESKEAGAKKFSTPIKNNNTGRTKRRFRLSPETVYEDEERIYSFPYVVHLFANGNPERDMWQKFMRFPMPPTEVLEIHLSDFSSGYLSDMWYHETTGMIVAVWSGSPLLEEGASFAEEVRRMTGLGFVQETFYSSKESKKFLDDTAEEFMGKYIHPKKRKHARKYAHRYEGAAAKLFKMEQICGEPEFRPDMIMDYSVYVTERNHWREEMLGAIDSLLDLKDNLRQYA